MNNSADAIRDSSLEAGGAAPGVTPAQRMYWLVRRELWENRSIYMAPLGVAALILAGFLISSIHLPARMRLAMELNPMQQQELIGQPFTFAALLIMATTFIVALFYCLDALHGERRDRSILFWKSLPVSDLETVLSKASIPLLVLPLLTFAIIAALQAIMLLVSTAVLLANGMSAAPLWAHLSFFQMSLMLLYHLLFIHGFWYAPIYCWLLLVSGWARRAAFLWAVLPLLAVGVVEKIAFNTSHFASLLLNRLGGGPEGAPFEAASVSMHPLMQLTPGRFLISPGLWIGLAVAAALLAGGVQQRRYRGPI
jgi:ABC-2 type transport system permease protein